VEELKAEVEVEMQRANLLEARVGELESRIGELEREAIRN